MPLTAQLGDAQLGDMELGSDGSVPATGYALTGPATGTAGQASANFTITATPTGAVFDGDTTFSPSDGASGVFSPSSVQPDAGETSFTFTVTEPAGSYEISASQDGGLADADPVDYDVPSVAVPGTGGPARRIASFGRYGRSFRRRR